MTLRPISTPGPVPPATAHSSSGLVQPLFTSAGATSDANGDITFAFSPVFTGQILLGSFSCPSAPYTAQFTAYNNSQEVYSWQSSNNPGPVRVSENQQITISGTGLVPDTQYVMNWTGYSTVSGNAPQIVPESHTDVVIATNQGGLQFTGAGSLSELTLYAYLPTPKAGYAYRIHSINCINQTAAAFGFALTKLLYGVASIPFFSTTVSATNSETFLMNGLLIPTAIESTVSTQTGLGIFINYDVIQI